MFDILDFVEQQVGSAHRLGMVQESLQQIIEERRTALRLQENRILQVDVQEIARRYASTFQ